MLAITLPLSQSWHRISAGAETALVQRRTKILPRYSCTGAAARTSASRRLLTAKALSHAAAAEPPVGEALEDSFPGNGAAQPEEPTVDRPKAAARLASSPTPALVWSDADEDTYQTLAARRAVLRPRNRGRDLSHQQLRVGATRPNPGTVTATIVSIVANRGIVTRADLIDAMQNATFSHPKAKPHDRTWCAGWLSGAVRGGFLVAADVSAESSGVSE